MKIIVTTFAFISVCSCSLPDRAASIPSDIRNKAIPWIDAEQIIISGKVISISTTHSGLVGISVNDGSYYYSTQKSEGIIYSTARRAENYKDIEWIME